MRPQGIEFEFEITDNGKAIAELDFAFMSRGKLIVGEAKSSDDLDGNTKAARVRDARKLITAGEVLGASEVCFASSKTWKQAAKDAVLGASADMGTRLTISLLENVGGSAPATRTVAMNPTGP
jgi:hypothetical protein